MALGSKIARRWRATLALVSIPVLGLTLLVAAAPAAAAAPPPVSPTCATSTGKTSSSAAVCGGASLSNDTSDPGQVAAPAGATACPTATKASTAVASCGSVADSSTPQAATASVARPVGASACPAVSGKQASTSLAACGTQTLATGSGGTPQVSLPAGQAACPSTTAKPSSATSSCPAAPAGTALATASGYSISLYASPNAIAPGASTTLNAYASVDVGPTPWWISIFDATTGGLLNYCGTGSSCSASVTYYSATTHGFIAFIAGYPNSYWPPSVQANSSTVYVTWLSINLSASAHYVAAGRSVSLTASVNTDVGPTPWWIEIFNESGQNLAICASGSSCSTSVSYGGPSSQSYIAYVSGYGTSLPPPNVQVSWGGVAVTWLTLSLSASTLYTGPGSYTTLTASASLDVGPTPYWLEIFDASSGANVAICASGFSCSVSLTHSSGTVRNFVAYVSGYGQSNPPPSVVDTSNTVAVTWFSISLSSSRHSYVWSNPAQLTATTNADVGPSPYYIEIFDQTIGLNVAICGRGSSCSGPLSESRATTDNFVAYVSLYGGSAPPPSVQVTSNVVSVTWYYWGVDTTDYIDQSCGSGSGTCYQQVQRAFGTPDFFGRYIGGSVGYHMHTSEIGYAHSLGLAIMPIYDPATGSTLGRTNGVNNANDAASIARSLGIPSGVIIVVDIEPSPGGAIDYPYIQGWVDQLTAKGYQPGFYESPDNNFGVPYCQSGRYSMLNSFEPSGGYTSKSASPPFGPVQPGCSNLTNIWQYAINVPDPNIDDDEALASAPLWHP
jgi:hypothetical protein